MSEKIANKYVLSFGEDRQEVPADYILEPFQEFISQDEYDNKIFPAVGEENRKLYFAKLQEQQDLKQTLVDSFTVDQLKKLKEMLS